jgi:hypothetical protein
VKGIPVLLQPVDDGFTATLLEANIAGSGESEEQPIPNLLSCGPLRGLVFRTSGRTWTGTQASTRGPSKSCSQAPMLTKDHAEAIAKKLKAKVRPGRSHDIAVIEYGDRRIAQFSIRRGSCVTWARSHPEFNPGSAS